jgi:hypothetical protein
MYGNRPFAQSNRRPRHERRRERPVRDSVPSVEQITQLMKTINTPTVETGYEHTYDPDHWSILPNREQQYIEKVVFQAHIYELSIHYVLQVTRMKNTPSVIAFIVDCIKRRYNTPIL